MIGDPKDEPCFPEKKRFVSCQIQVSTLFKNNYGRKRSRCDRNIQQAVKIPVNISQTNKNLFVTVQPKSACKFEFADRLWVLFID